MARPELVVARNPDPDSSLPYLIRLPLGVDGVMLKARATWPRTAKVSAMRPQNGRQIPTWSSVSPFDPASGVALPSTWCSTEQGESLPDRVHPHPWWTRGDLLAERANRQAGSPNVGLPRARSAAGRLTILVDAHERYPWRFAHQQAETERRALLAGDYAVELGGKLAASVERKTLADLVSTLTTGKLRYLLAELAALPRAALVIEDRYSSVFRLDHVRPTVVADGLAEAQVRFPEVPIVFCETRPLAEEWTYRFLGAALQELGSQEAMEVLAADFWSGGTCPACRTDQRRRAGMGVSFRDPACPPRPALF